MTKVTLDQLDLAAGRVDALDPAGARDLVGLRHRAFDDLRGATGPEPWPPAVSDPFPDADGLPEIGPDQLDATVLGGTILHHGALIVRGFVAPPGVDRLVADIDRAFTAFDAWSDGASLDEVAPDFVPFRPTGEADNITMMRKFIRNNGGVWTVDAPAALCDLVECFDAVDLRAVLEGWFGERPAMSMNKGTLRRVPVDAHPEWHQDGAFLGPGIRSVNVWIALTDCGGDADCPGLDVVPRRLDELAPTATDGAYFDTSVGHALVERIAGDRPIERPVFRAGDALLFDELFLHRTATAEGMTRERYAVETWFFAPSRYPERHVPLVL
jgi:hypothetical protein